jgi:GGDEF domain-containing protein
VRVTLVRVTLVAGTVAAVLARVAYDAVQITRSGQDAQWRAGHDSLTGLLSRHALLSEVSRRLPR